MKKGIVIAMAALYALIATPSSAILAVAPVVLSGCLPGQDDPCDQAKKDAQDECYNSGLTPYVCTKQSEDKVLGVTVACEYSCSCQ